MDEATAPARRTGAAEALLSRDGDLRIPPASLRRLSARCGELGSGGVVALREAGRTAGRSLHDGLGNGAEPADLGLDAFWSELRRAAGERGLGRAEYEVLAADVARVAIHGSPEATPPDGDEGASARRGCHFAVGWLGGALTAAAGEPVSVLEVSCGAGSAPPCCRFLVGCRDRLEEIRGSLRNGASVEEALEYG